MCNTEGIAHDYVIVTTGYIKPIIITIVGLGILEWPGFTIAVYQALGLQHIRYSVVMSHLLHILDKVYTFSLYSMVNPTNPFMCAAL